MTEQPKVEDWMEDVDMDDPCAEQPCMGPRRQIHVDSKAIAQAYAPEAARVKALVELVERIAKADSLEDCDEFDCGECNVCLAKKGIDDYRKGEG